MLNGIIDRLKQFEVILKKCILDRFGSNLPENKKQILNNTNYVDDNIMNGLKNGNEIQGRILRLMLDSIIDFKCEKNFILKNGSSISVLYGEDIENELIELYAAEIAQKYKFNINVSTSPLESANTIKAALGDGFDFNILNLNSITIMDNPNLSLFTTNYNETLLKKYEVESTADNINTVEVSNNTGLEVIDLSNSSTEITPNYVTDISEEVDSILTDEEYQQLCMKYARNEEMTQEEFNKLLKATPNLLNNGNVEEFAGHNVSVLSNDEASKMELGYTSSSLALYLFTVFIIFLIVLGIILF